MTTHRICIPGPTGSQDVIKKWRSEIGRMQKAAFVVVRYRQENQLFFVCFAVTGKHLSERIQVEPLASMDASMESMVALSSMEKVVFQRARCLVVCLKVLRARCGGGYNVLRGDQGKLGVFWNLTGMKHRESFLGHLCHVLSTARVAALSLRNNQCDDKMLEQVEFPFSLEELDLSNNALERIPSQVARMSGLQILRVDGNRIRVVKPSEFPNTLCYLNLSGNKLMEFPCEVYSLPSMRELKISLSLQSREDSDGLKRQWESFELAL